MRFRAILSAAVLLGAAAAAVPEGVCAQQSGGGITGTVVNKQASQPLSGAQVFLQNTRYGTVTNENGAFLLPGVPPGTYTAVVQMLGFAQSTQQVIVRAGATAQLKVEMAEQVLPLQELVVSGVVDPTAGVKLPFTVARVSSEQLQVPSMGSAVASLAGKVAGASVMSNSGKPGAGVQIQLRTPTFSEGIAQNQPLYVVDGVVLSQTLANPIQDGGGAVAVQPSIDFLDIDPNDIESIEIIKGAAASSLYGSRASAGVISITTKRGRSAALGTTRVNYRMEFGKDFVGREMPLSSSHHYRLNADGTRFVNSAGDVVLYNSRSTDPRRIQDKAWPGQVFNNTDLLYQPGEVITQNVTLTQNNQNTNFVLAVNRLDQAGALRGNDGYWRNQGRINLDHRIGDRFTVAFTGLHSRSWEDITQGNPYLEGMRFAPFVNLALRDTDGSYLQIPDSTVLIENPLWVQQTRDHWDARSRTNASLNTRYSATRWLSMDAQLSYDRSDTHTQRYTPKGVPTSPTADVPSAGILVLSNRRADAYNGSAAITALKHFGELTTRTTVRGTFERDRNEGFNADGRDFVVEGTRDLGSARTLTHESSSQEIRSNGFLLNLGLDFRDKYVFDGLVRRDGSSLFGPDERWHNYYRAAGSYLISRESWLNLPHVDELVLRYSIGTAGGRPTFTQQYESWNVSRTTGLSRNTAGNAQLKPHTTTEQEGGITSVLFGNRLSIELTYATQTSENQIIALAVPTISGFNSILGNAGKIKGWTYEGTVNARILNTRDMTFSVNAVADRSRNKILYWGRSCFMGHTITATLSNHEFSCAGESRGDMWGNKHLKSTDQLPAHLQARASEFQVNDDGYLVWVGPDNTWRDGIAKSLWGTNTSSGGVTYFWGEPILDKDANNVNVFHKFGTMLPDVNFGFTPNFRYKNLNLYAEFRGQLNGIVYNRAKQDLYNELRHADVDQSGKPDESKKTIDYYQRGLRASNLWIEHFVEDGTYLKVGALSARYRVPASWLRQIPGINPSSVTVGVAGRNLLTLTGYSGFDPESGRALSRVETLDYPALRSLTMTLDITF